MIIPVTLAAGDRWMEDESMSNTRLACSVVVVGMEPFYIFVRHVEKHNLRRSIVLINELLKHPDCHGLLYVPMGPWLDSRLGKLDARVFEVPCTANGACDGKIGGRVRHLIYDTTAVRGAFPYLPGNKDLSTCAH